jgi:hypothetical protein
MSEPSATTGFFANSQKRRSARDAAVRVTVFCITTTLVFLIAIRLTPVSPGTESADFASIAIPF